MTEKMVKQIKNILKKENVEIVSTYHDRNWEFRVKVIQFMERSYLGWEIVKTNEKQKEIETREIMIKVLRALERNGLRPKYRKEQRETSNAIGMYDCRYLIFE